MFRAQGLRFGGLGFGYVADSPAHRSRMISTGLGLTLPYDRSNLKVMNLLMCLNLTLRLQIAQCRSYL